MLTGRRHRLLGAALTATLAAMLMVTAAPARPGGSSAESLGRIKPATLSMAALTPAPKWTVLQVRTRYLYVYRANGTVLAKLSNPNRYGEPLVLLGLGHSTAWWYAQLPIRPNGATGWVRAINVTPATTPYEIHIYRFAHRLNVLRNGRLIYRAIIAVGAAAAPTPSGRYFVTMLLRPANPYGPYGPWAFGLSAFSNVYTSFSNGTGEIGLHGTNQPWLLGTDVSHGCIRVSNAAITKIVYTVPVGSPVFIHA